MAAPIRPEWMIRAANLCQTAIGVVLTGDVAIIDKAASELARHGRYATPLERTVLKGLLADLATHIHAAIRHGAAGDEHGEVGTDQPSCALSYAPGKGTLQSMVFGVSDVIPSADDILALARTYISVHYADHVTVEELARRFRIAPHTLEREWRRRYGPSISVHLRNLRLAEADALVAEGVKLEAAVLAVGWRSKSSLYRARRARGRDQLARTG